MKISYGGAVFHACALKRFGAQARPPSSGAHTCVPKHFGAQAQWGSSTFAPHNGFRTRVTDTDTLFYRFFHLLDFHPA
jgi:hypothetical protein